MHARDFTVQLIWLLRTCFNVYIHVLALHFTMYTIYMSVLVTSWVANKLSIYLYLPCLTRHLTVHIYMICRGVRQEQQRARSQAMS